VAKSGAQFFRSEIAVRKIFGIYQNFSQAMKEDAESNDSSHFFSVARVVIDECIQYIQTKYSVSLPKPEIRICNNKEFEQLLSNRIWFGRKGGILEQTKNLESFIGNLVLNAMEELTHWAFPADSEPEVKLKTHDATEDYLQYPIPSDYKEDSLKLAREPDY
jgi:hypothetical protein